MREHGANWGIFHVKAALERLRVRPPRRNIARTLQVLSGVFYSSIKMLINFIFLLVFIYFLFHSS